MHTTWKRRIIKRY